MDLRASVRSDFRQRFESSRDRESNSSWAVQRSEGHPLTGQESSARRSRTDSMHETGKLPHDPQPQGLGPVHTLKPVAPSGRRNTREVPPTLPRFHVTTFHQSMIPSVVPSEQSRGCSSLFPFRTLHTLRHWSTHRQRERHTLPDHSSQNYWVNSTKVDTNPTPANSTPTPPA